MNYAYGMRFVEAKYDRKHCALSHAMLSHRLKSNPDLISAEPFPHMEKTLHFRSSENVSIGNSLVCVPSLAECDLVIDEGGGDHHRSENVRMIVSPSPERHCETARDSDMQARRKPTPSPLYWVHKNCQQTVS
uniref:Uncharacterized protein n=1 Tax=Steinernema glaseri TaxID=37863 RepID=A0A1I7YWP7_9BILA